VNRPVRTGGVRKNNIAYPQNLLDYRGNVLNEKAKQFYQRHGVIQINPAAESGVNMSGKQVMKTKYCVRKQLGLCSVRNRSGEAEPLILQDRENHTFELQFCCPNCGMEIYFVNETSPIHNDGKPSPVEFL